jgi:hypothetical protein
MMKLAIPALAAALALTACDSTPEADDAMADSTTAATDNGAMAAPTATETVVATPGAAVTAEDGTTTVTTGPGGTSVKVDGRDVDASIGPDGATATVTPDR